MWRVIWDLCWSTPACASVGTASWIRTARVSLFPGSTGGVSACSGIDSTNELEQTSSLWFQRGPSCLFENGGALWVWEPGNAVTTAACMWRSAKCGLSAHALRFFLPSYPYFRALVGTTGLSGLGHPRLLSETKLFCVKSWRLGDTAMTSVPGFGKSAQI